VPGALECVLENQADGLLVVDTENRRHSTWMSPGQSAPSALKMEGKGEPEGRVKEANHPR